MSDCTVAKDGTLKDANNIKWFNDADDLVPLPQTHPLIAGSSASSVISLDNFFASCLPARKVGSEHHSTWIRKPSKRTIDPDNAEGSGNAVEDVASGRKQRFSISAASHRVARKIVESESASEKAVLMVMVRSLTMRNLMVMTLMEIWTTARMTMTALSLMPSMTG